MNDDYEKSELPIHVFLGASDFSRIKTETKPKIGLPSEPIAELPQAREDHDVYRRGNRTF